MIYLMSELQEKYKFIHRFENHKNDKCAWGNFNKCEIYVSEKLYPYLMNREIDFFYYPEIWNHHQYNDEYYKLPFYNFIISKNPPEQTFLLCSDNKHLYSKLKLLF